MPINQIFENQKLTTELDQAIVERSVTGFLADNTLKTKFVGTKTVMIPDLGLQGLGNYDVDNGFVRGSVSVSARPYVLNMDRGRSFQIDREEADESGIPELAGKITGEFVRGHVIPEVDAYVLSALAGVADAANKAVSGTPDTEAYKMLIEAIRKVQEEVGYDEELVAFVDGTFDAALQATPEINRHLVINDFKKGELTTKVKSLNGVAILPVPSSRMKTAYTFNDGETGGQEGGGFTPTGDAKSIGLLVMPKKGASLIKKTEKIRVFSPDQNLKADAWKIDYRIYYDVVVKNSYSKAVCAYTY